MSNHFSATNLKHPGDDARLGLRPLRIRRSHNPDRTALIMDSDPFAKGNGFHPHAVYRFNIAGVGDPPAVTSPARARIAGCHVLVARGRVRCGVLGLRHRLVELGRTDSGRGV
jgi:hypothetical protein